MKLSNGERAALSMKLEALRRERLFLYPAATCQGEKFPAHL